MKTKRLKYSMFRIREDNILSISVKNGNVSKDGKEFMFNNIMLVPREARALRDFLNQNIDGEKKCHVHDSQITCKSNLIHVCTQPHWEYCEYGKLHEMPKKKHKGNIAQTTKPLLIGRMKLSTFRAVTGS